MGWDWVHLIRRSLISLFYQPRMIDDECGAVGGIKIGRENRSATLSTSNPGRRGGKPATNRLSYGTASICSRSDNATTLGVILSLCADPDTWNAIGGAMLWVILWKY
jgi:hypothetical protein